VEYADRLIHDLLDVARMQSGKLTLDAQATDPRALVHESVELQKPMANQRRIRLEPVTTEDLPPVEADRHRLQQVLGNLLANAIKFSPEGSTVSVIADLQKDSVRFSVKDEGPGIAPQEMPHLFDPFWQARKGAGGAGLGLAICKGIVKAHGGQIWVDSKPGEGSTFHFTLPLAPESQQSDHSLAAD
jgi:signal transduction histidine kinase